MIFVSPLLLLCLLVPLVYPLYAFGSALSALFLIYFFLCVFTYKKKNDCRVCWKVLAIHLRQTSISLTQ